MDETLASTYDSIREVMKQYKKKNAELHSETDLLKDGILDSLELIEVIVLMEKKTGKKPFAEGFIPFHTIQELANIYK